MRDILVEAHQRHQATPTRPTRYLGTVKRKLTWANGAIGTTFSAEPDRLRGPQFRFAWLDEPAHMPFIADVWSNLLLALRLGHQPRAVCCTTRSPG